ncbi:hypothetical protein Q7C36_006200 [Tachysurus vachellii]|uniref:Uncharacterized protein n=1 Tax=Tachysurus vachellii TaxID=175792 RepID=A0AA88T109_TACVA|nr:hypothetical protein Q7C36_006200 [Tachysurus vachellii]
MDATSLAEIPRHPPPNPATKAPLRASAHLQLCIFPDVMPVKMPSTEDPDTSLELFECVVQEWLEEGWTL